MARAIALFSFSLFACAACGGTTTVGDPGDTGTTGDGSLVDTGGTGAVTVDQACADVSNAYCDRLQACSSALIELVYGDVAQCKARFGLACPQIFAAKGTAWTPEKVRACATSVPGLSCGDLWAGRATPACVPAPGSVIDGQACGDDSQCASTFCANPDDASCGTCAPLSTAGSACVKGKCSRGFGCADSKCQPIGVLGDTCDTRTRPCANGLACFGGKCVEGGKPGAACDSTGAKSPTCDGTQAAFCNPLTNVCQKAVAAKAGETCGIVGSDFKFCTASGTCKTPAGGTSGTCVATAADGAACDPGAAGPHCLPPAKCIGGVCKLPDASACR
jgi:hypothetical protein